MSEATERQLNNRFSVVPPELFGKDGSARFQSSGKRLTSSTILTGALFSTRENVLGNGCKTSYTDITKELGYARATNARNVKKLTDSGIFNRFGQSKYTAVYSLDTKHGGLPVYHFLRTETFNDVRLSGNDVLAACNVIRHYLNDEREQKYFIGGESRVASFLNCVESTAHGVINRLLKSGIIQRFVLHDGKLSEGKGINGDYQTVYIVNDKILKRVRDIRKAIRKQKSEQEALRKLFSEKPEPKPAASSNKPRKRNLIDQWQSALALLQEKAENSAEAIAKRFATDFTFNQLKRDYINTKGKHIEAIIQSRGQETAAMSELEKKLDNILSDVLNYLQAHNVPRTYIPDDWQAFVREILKP